MTRCTFSTFERITPDLSPSQRLAVFLALPEPLQDEAWRELGERIDRDSRALIAEDEIGGTGTVREVAATIAALWPEIQAVPLAGAQLPARPIPAEPRSRPETLDGDLGVLRTIPSSDYVPILAGVEVTRGFVECPVHGPERTPSLHVSEEDGRWHCFGCGAGGGIIEFAAALDGRTVPRGVEFVEFVRDLAERLRGVRC